MALPTIGSISLSQVNVELGRNATQQISLNESAVRTLFGRGSGAISLQDGRGKANEFAFTIASNVTNANLRTLAVNAGWNQTSKVVATINSGVYISSNSTGTRALTINGSFPNGVELINNGFIVGMGGAGGRGGSVNFAGNATVPGSAGGPALIASVAVSIRNNNTIGGGGGGGGGGAPGFVPYSQSHPGSGGGGGRSSAAANSSGGAAGTAGMNDLFGNSGGAGTASSAGSGGASRGSGSSRGGAGGNGGGWGGSGASGLQGAQNWGSGIYRQREGGGGGQAVSGNSNITWLATGTRLGAIS